MRRRRERLVNGEWSHENLQCESCQRWTRRMCARCGQRICRKCATNHQRRNYDNPAELQDIGLCKAVLHAE